MSATGAEGAPPPASATPPGDPAGSAEGRGGGMLLLGSLLLVGAGMGSIVMQLYGPAMLCFLGAGVLAVARVSRRRAGETTAVSPVRVPPEEAELVDGPVWCCMRCGSIQMRQPAISEGLIPGVPLGWICGRCKWRGQPLQFDDVTAYRQFVKGLQEPAQGEPQQQ